MRERVEAMIRDQRANGSIQYRFAKALLCDLLVGQSSTITKFGDPIPQEISLLDHGAYISYPLSDSTDRNPQTLQINVSKDSLQNFATITLGISPLPKLTSHATIGRMHKRYAIETRKGTHLPDAAMACSIKSACCETLGLPDDFWELETLRQFRNQHLIPLGEHSHLVEEYYALSPLLPLLKKRNT